MKTDKQKKALQRARIAKNDEYYTYPNDAELELTAYEDGCWKDKVVLCPFDANDSAYV